MDKTRFYSWDLEFDPAATARSYAAAEPLDPGCCNACATFVEATRRGNLPASVVACLHRVGADPAKPGEVWGAPDGGFLAGWWSIAGRLLDGAWDGGAEGAYAEPAPGFRCYLVPAPSGRRDQAFGDLEQVQLEFEREHPHLVELEQIASLRQEERNRPR
jgi:hypothetical protein